MKIGDVLFLVPKNFPISDAFLAPVWYSGATRFSAGEYTFVGSHWRFGKAYESEGAFAETLGKRVAWRELRYTVARLEDAPANLSAAQIIEFINLLKGKQ
jgi:hypothetical protein